MHDLMRERLFTKAIECLAQAKPAIYNFLRLTINFGSYLRENTQALPWKRKMKRFLANISQGWKKGKKVEPNSAVI